MPPTIHLLMPKSPHSELIDDAPEEEDDWADDDVAPDPPLPEPIANDEGTLIEELDLDVPPEFPPEPDTDGTPLDDLLGLEEEDSAWPSPIDDLVALPWSLTVCLTQTEKTLPAILDPTREFSHWVRPNPTTSAEAREVDLGPLTVKVELRPETGLTEHLRLGRDVLSGRILVRS
jgi:hypothetical protein